MTKTCKSFEQFYLSRHSGRRLTWQPSLGNADVRVVFKAKKIELNVSTLALVILLQFQDLDDDTFLTYTVRSYPPIRALILADFPPINRRLKMLLQLMILTYNEIFNL